VSPLESWVTDRWKISVEFLWTFLIICSRVALRLNRATYLSVTLWKFCFNTRIVTFLTHILRVSSWIMGDRAMENIYWLLMNFPDNLLTGCTSIEKDNLPSSHIGKIYFINTRIVTFLTYILCVPSWIMGDGQMENIYWLLMNFPDNLLTSSTSIEQVNLPCSHIVKMLYQHRIVTFLTHILCVSSWIMVDGRMEKICWTLMNFPDNLLTSCTSIDQDNLPSSHIGKYIISTPG
jgi:hypothetical protein